MNIDEDDDEILQNEATAIISRRIEPGSERLYKSKLKTWINWLKKNYPNHIRNDEVMYDSIESNIYILFFTCMTKYTLSKSTPKKKGNNKSFQNVSGFKSAIRYDWVLKKFEPPSIVLGEFKTFFAGYKRTVADLKLKGEMEIKEGKSPFSFTAYQFLAEKSFSNAEDSLKIFAHIFLLLCWNLIARCISVSGIRYEHVFWKDDALVIIFAKHKGDQEGDSALPKHVYANPTRPSCCPILALALYEFTLGYREKIGLMFQAKATATESRFGKWLLSICKEYSAQLQQFGIEIKDIGTHSFRKGVSSFVTSIPGGPSVISVYLRAGWSLGPVQSRYILEGEGGDQLCGRAASGLPVTDVTFASLPPHFLPNTIIDWSLIIPHFELYPDNFKPGIYYHNIYF
jgi:hypothetical protein